MASLLQKIKGKIGIKRIAKSETSKVRHLVLKYCVGLGCDIGHGGDKIKPSAVGIDLPTPYTCVGRHLNDFPWDIATGPIPIPNNYFDYVYSSHLIEDFEDTGKILMEFARILKTNGNLILVFPNQMIYEGYCCIRNRSPNPHHAHKTMGFDFMMDAISVLPMKWEVLYISDCEIDYNVILVLKIIAK